MSYSGWGIVIGVIIFAFLTLATSQIDAKQEIQQVPVNNRHLPATATQVKDEGNGYFSYCLDGAKILRGPGSASPMVYIGECK